MSKKMCLCEVKKKYFPKSKIMIVSKDEKELIERYRNNKKYVSKA